MYTLTINLTKTLVAEWAFSNLGDFERAGVAARAVLVDQRLIDTHDLQVVMDATLAPFDAWPSDGDIAFNLYSSLERTSAIAA